jgi:hypothetical protein
MIFIKKEEKIYFSDEEIEEMKNIGMIKKDPNSCIWEINEEKYIFNRATNEGIWFTKIKNTVK